MRFDIQRHNIRQLTIADAIHHYQTTRSANYKLKLRTHLKLADARLRGLIAKAKRSKLCMSSPSAVAGLDAMRRDAELIAEALRH